MARANDCVDKFELLHRIKFRSIIRGHHVYKANWTPVLKEELFAKPDERDEAKEYDPFSIGIFKLKDDGESKLVGHAPIELSSLLTHFLNADSGNFIKVTVIGKRKREIGLVIPAKFECYSKIKKNASVLDEQNIGDSSPKKNYV